MDGLGTGARTLSHLFLSLPLAVGSPAFADSSTALSAFRYLCLGGGYIAASGPDRGAYPDSIKIDPALLLRRLPPKANAETVDAWDLTPNDPPGNRLALAIVLFDHPTMGQMAACTILAEGVTSVGLEQGLLDAGAERDGKFLFMEGVGRLWFVSSGAPEVGTGDGLLMAATPNSPPPE